MEFIQHEDGSRTPIPDAVVAASDNRDLIGQYANAGAAERARILTAAIEKTSPKQDVKAPAPASEELPVAGGATE